MIQLSGYTIYHSTWSELAVNIAGLRAGIRNLDFSNTRQFC